MVVIEHPDTGDVQGLVKALFGRTSASRVSGNLAGGMRGG